MYTYIYYTGVEKHKYRHYPMFSYSNLSLMLQIRFSSVQNMKKHGIDLVLFPDIQLCGSPCRDELNAGCTVYCRSPCTNGPSADYTVYLLADSWKELTFLLKYSAVAPTKINFATDLNISVKRHLTSKSDMRLF